MSNNVYMIITAADVAARHGDVAALRRCKLDLANIAHRSSGSYYLRALIALRYVKDLMLELGY